MTSARSLLSVIALAFTTSIFAATPLPPRADFAQILVPIPLGDFNGQLGSLWRNELWVRNDGDTPAHVFRVTVVPSDCPPLCGGSSFAPDTTAAISPHTSARIEPRPTGWSSWGDFLYVERAATVFFDLRTRDMSRAALSAGTRIPLLVDGAGARSRVQLLNVPADSRFRYTLRLFTYTTTSQMAPPIHVRLYDLATDALLDDQTIYVAINATSSSVYTLVPAKNEFAVDVPGRAQGAAAVRMELESDDTTFWPLLTITNNESGEVTVVTPQP